MSKSDSKPAAKKADKPEAKAAPKPERKPNLTADRMAVKYPEKAARIYEDSERKA